MRDFRGERDAKSWVYGLGMRERQRFEVGFWVWDKREARVWDEFVDLGWERDKEFEGEEICELRDILIIIIIIKIIKKLKIYIILIKYSV